MRKRGITKGSITKDSRNKTKSAPKRSGYNRDESASVDLPRLSQSEVTAITSFIDLERRTRQLRGLWRFSRHLSDLSSDQLLHLLPKIAIQVLDAEAASVQLYDSEHDTLIFHAVEDPMAPNLVGYTIPATKGIGGRVVRSGQANITLNVQESSDYNSTVEEKTGRRIESLLTVPLKNKRGSIVGVVQVLTGTAEFWNYDIEFLQVLVALAAGRLTEEPLQKGQTKAKYVFLIPLLTTMSILSTTAQLVIALYQHYDSKYRVKDQSQGRQRMYTTEVAPITEGSFQGQQQVSSTPSVSL